MAIMYSLQLVRLREVPCAGQLPPVAPMLRLHQPCYASLASASSLLAGKKFVQNLWCLPLLNQCQSSTQVAPKVSCAISSHSVTSLNQSKEMTVVLMKVSSALCTRVFKAMQESGLFVQCAPAVGLMAFAMWGLGPVLRIIRRVVLQKEDRHWKESQTLFILNSYLRPLILWIGVITICRAFDPIMLSTEASQAIKQRVLNFVRSLSTVLAFAYCTASLTQQLQKLMVDRQDSHDSRSVGVQFIGNTVYTAVWVAAVCLFMELLGFSTQRWLTAGGLGTVLLTLAGREIFTNFLSSIMIHATRPFVENEWIQTKIEGYEVSGTVEHVGWWSPTIVRGDDREAVHIPNHKFTVSVVRNLSQKTHWRIKTHFGISHLDVSKITNIVADMRKVLAKHPQVEQRRLHRRVFFDNIDPENQALLILVSCFVKTPHFEEYQRVKEIILLDLLKVISHHHARLATPIRSVQRIFDDTESRNAPFRDMASRSTDTHGRPFLLIEASSIANQQHEVEQSAKDVNGTSHRKEDTEKGIDTSETGTAKPGTGSSSAVNGKSDLKDSNTIESKSDFKSPVKQKENIAGEVSLKTGGLSVEAAAVSSTTKPQLEGLDSMGLNSKDITLLGAAFEKPPAKILDGLMESGPPKDVPQGEKVGARSTTDHQYQAIGSKDEQLPPKVGEKDATFPGPDKVAQEDFSGAELAVPGPIVVDSRIDTRRPQALGTATSSCPSPSKQECDRSSPGMSAAPRPQLEENLVLGVALDGPKRTLPLDEDISSPNDQKELVTSRNGNTNTAFKDRRESSQATSSSGPTDVRDRER